MTKPKPEYWCVELTMDHPNRLFAVRRIDRDNSFAYNPVFCVRVEALDEIGAYNEARKVLTRLGFRADDINFAVDV